MPATVPQAQAVVTAIAALQVRQSDLSAQTMKAANSNGPVTPAMQQTITGIATDLTAALALANTVLTNTP